MHGIGSAADTWWRLGTPDAPTFADLLEAQLAERGLAGSVWRPAIAAGFNEASFAWSGHNRHTDRIEGARHLAATLRALADRTGATAADPLVVHFVAHSHGGNVSLEALRHLPAHGPVRPGAMVLMGTPLIEARPALRLFRFAMALVVSLAVLGWFGVALFFPHAVPIPAWQRWGLVAAAFVGYRWVLALLGWAGDMLWTWLSWPLRFVRGRAAGQVYGPAADTLRRLLGERKVLLLTSHQDEADLLAQFTVAPLRLYGDWVRQRFGRFGRTMEWLLVRPLMEGFALGVLETVLERTLGGFDWARVLLFDFDVAILATSRAYPVSAFERVDVTAALLHAIPPGAAVQAVPVQRVEAAGLLGANRQVASLAERLRTAFEYLFTQLHPRHSDYHNSPTVVGRIADAIVAR